MAEDRDAIRVFGINDTPREWEGELRFGLFGLQGGLPMDERRPVTMPPNASTPLAEIPRRQWQAIGLRQAGAFALLLAAGETVAQHRLFLARFRDLALAPPAIEVQRDDGRLVLSCPTFAWGVCLDLDGEEPVPDNAFDLLPGIAYPIPWPPELPTPKVLRTGNDLLVSAAS